jgi:hypothetical protein
MVITINGVQKMKGHLFCNREIIDVTAEKHFGSWYYIFYFNELTNKSNSPYPQWEGGFDIRLKREPKNGTYELYWMGLHGVTCQQLHKSEIENFQTFYSYFEKVVRLGKTYWDESKTYRN